jgi:hypothetical protein
VESNVHSLIVSFSKIQKLVQAIITEINSKIQIRPSKGFHDFNMMTN